MCRSNEEGGRRCNHHNPYGIQKRNLQAQKQYHEHRLTKDSLTLLQKEKSEKTLASTLALISALNEEKASLGFVKPYVMGLTPATEKVLAQLESDGFKPYIVGGSVRDALMGYDSKDIDIEVYGGQPNSIAKSLRKLGNVDEVGKSFGVFKIRLGTEDFDISLPRIDSKTGDGHKEFEVTVDPDLSLKEATSRRDFTINALMYSHKLGFIIDQHGGLKDLENKQLRHVSDAFDEDPLRVLRGVQMASRFNMDLHPDTIEKSQTLRNSYKELAQERVQGEFEKLYSKGKYPVKALKLLKEIGWDEHFAGLAKVNSSSLYRQVNKMQKLIDSGVVPKNRRDLFLSATIANQLSDRDRYKFLSSTTIGSDVKNAANNLSTMKAPIKQGKSGLRNWAYGMPRRLSIRDWTILESAIGNEKEAARILKKAEKWGIADESEPDLINGQDILVLKSDIRPGPWVKKDLDKIRQAQYSDQFRTREGGLAWIKKNI